MSAPNLDDRTRVNFFIDSKVLAALKHLAAIQNVPYSDLIRSACWDYIVIAGPVAVSRAKALRDIPVGKPS